MTGGFLGDEEFLLVLGAARNGKAWAFERLFHFVAQPLVGFFRTQGSDDPDGLANDTLLRVFRSIEGFAGDAGAFRAWAFAIARCRLIDERRARACRPQCVPFAGRHHLNGDSTRAVASSEASALARLGDDWVRDTLDGLAPDQREVLVLRIVADLSIEQVAAALGKTPGAVKSLQHRGLAAIRRNFLRQTVSL